MTCDHGQATVDEKRFSISIGERESYGGASVTVPRVDTWFTPPGISISGQDDPGDRCDAGIVRERECVMSDSISHASEGQEAFLLALEQLGASADALKDCWSVLSEVNRHKVRTASPVGWYSLPAECDALQQWYAKLLGTWE